MKKNYSFLIIVGLLFLPFCNNAQGIWTQKANYDGTGGMGKTVGFSVGTKGYIYDGFNKDFWEYDPATDTWTQKADFGGTARIDAVGFNIGNKGYIGTGDTLPNQPSAGLTDFWEYNPSLNTWIQKSNFLGHGRFKAVGFSIGSKGYIGLGWYISSYYSPISLCDFWEYDPVWDSWSQKASPPCMDYPCNSDTITKIGSISPVGFSINNLGYVGTGRYESLGGACNTKGFSCYDLTSNSWSSKANFPGNVRNNAIGFSMGSYGYIGSGGYNDFWEYDSSSDSWTQKSNIPGTSGVGFSIGTKGYFGTGYNDFWEFYSCNSFSLSSSQLNVNCNGGNNGSANVFISNGVPPYSYLWNTAPPQNTSAVTGLSAGTYFVTVSDAIGCSKTATVVITQPTAITLTTTTIDANCLSNGTASVNANGGTPPYSYLWSNGQSSQTATSIYAGGHIVTVTDANGCTSSATAIVNQLSGPSTSMSSNNISCFGGSNGNATANIIGGIPPYNYSWSNGGVTPFIGGLTAGTYILLVTDGNGCVVTYAVDIKQPQQISITPWPENISCYGGSENVTAYVTGGIGSYIYNWSSGQTTATASNLTAGNYTITITDANSCTDTTNFTIVQPAPLSVSITISNQTFYSATLTANSTGGISPYTYFWSTGQKTQSITITQSGIYYVTITDANGCTISSSITGIENLAFQKDITSIYPNPSTGTFTLSIEGIKNTDLQVTVYNIMGNIVYREKAKLISSPYLKQLNLGTVSKGIYFIQVRTEAQIFNKKLIVE